MLGGRVKTLHPAIHAGILARRDDAEHMAALQKQGFGPIDLVVVNLYPFAQTAARAEATPAELVEEIDIGGPPMLRAAAHNFQGVAGGGSPDDYGRVIEELKASGTLSLTTRLELARKVFAATATYDSTIARTLEELQADGEAGLSRAAARDFPAVLSLAGRKAMDLRYGENPHQKAALYQSDGGGIAGARQLQGKELSYNNLLDLDAAWDLAREFAEPVCAIIKHTNPCGIAVAKTQVEAYEKALSSDPVSAFGSVIGFNQPVTAATAEAMSKLFVECVAAPGYEPAALALFAKKKNLRVMEIKPAANDRLRVRSIAGGWLVQDKDCGQLNPKELRTVTKRAPPPAQPHKSDPHPLRPRQPAHRRGGGTDEPRGFRQARGDEGARARPRRALEGLGDRLRCVLPLPRRRRRSGQGGCDRGDSARRLRPRPRSDRRRRPPRPSHALYGRPPLQTLTVILALLSFRALACLGSEEPVCRVKARPSTSLPSRSLGASGMTTMARSASGRGRRRSSL